MDLVTRRARAALCGAAAALALVAAACGGDDPDDEPAEARQAPAAADATASTAQVDHPLHPLTTVRLKVFRGSERDPETGETLETRVEARVLDRTRSVDGLESAVVAVKDFEGGELVESTRDYYAQRGDGSVLYMGEHVDDYEGGKVVGHGGQWLAGEDGAKAGVFMPGAPEVGQSFEQERAPGVAEDRSTVVARGRTVTTPAGTFEDCIRTKDYAPLDKLTEYKLYCPGVGLVREDLEDGRVELVRYR